MVEKEMSATIGELECLLGMECAIGKLKDEETQILVVL